MQLGNGLNYMKKKIEDKNEVVEKHKDYVEFLRKRVQSKNYKENSSEEDFKKTLKKYDKAKLKLKFMLM